MSTLMELKFMMFAFYCFSILLICFIAALSMLGILKQYFPQRYQTVLKHIRKFSKVQRWLKKGEFDKLISYYQLMSEKKKKLKYFYSGLAKLYAYEFDDAITFFEKHIPFAIGERQVWNAKGYIAMAQLGKKSYHLAFYTLEDCRKHGFVFHVPYILSLLTTRQYSRAREFYEMYPISSSVRNVIEALIGFDPNNSTTLDIIRMVIEMHNPQLHISQPVIEAILEQYKMELYFQDSSALENLQLELAAASNVLSEHALFFQSPRMQWLRKYLMQSFDLFPLVVWMDGLKILTESVEDDQVQDVLRKIEWLSKDKNHSLRFDDYERFFYELLPTSVQQIMLHNGFAKYTVFEDEKLHLGFLERIVEERGRDIQYRIIPWEEVSELKQFIIPILSIQRNVSTDIRASFDRIIFDWMENRNNKSYWLHTVIPIIDKLPKEFQRTFEDLKNHYALL